MSPIPVDVGRSSMHRGFTARCERTQVRITPRTVVFIATTAASRIARHQAINDVIARAITAAGVPVIKEPVGLARLDGKRPDGLTLIPWQGGKPLTWDVTVVSTLADSYLYSTSHSAGGAAETASNRKETSS